MRQVCEASLANVGVENTFSVDAEEQRITIQRRKFLSVDEIAQLPPEKLPHRWAGHGVLLPEVSP